MEIPILLGARPKTAHPVAWIPIRFSEWVSRVEGLENSKLVLYSRDPDTKVTLTLSLNGQVFHGPCLVQVEFVKRGTEKSLSIFAVERIEKDIT